MVRPLATRSESGGRFSVFCMEASSLHCGKGLEETMLGFARTHHAIQIVDGEVVRWKWPWKKPCMCWRGRDGFRPGWEGREDGGRERLGKVVCFC